MVDSNYQVVYDSLVQPENAIIDYLTRLVTVSSTALKRNFTLIPGQGEISRGLVGVADLKPLESYMSPVLVALSGDLVKIEM